MIDPDDWFLESAIATALEEATANTEPPAVAAKRVLAALAERTSWVATKTEEWFEAATAFGGESASIISCCHYYQYSNDALAGDPEKRNNPDDVDYLHICELDGHIAELIGLRQLYLRWKAGEELPPCEHPAKAGQTVGGVLAEWCQACGQRFENGEPVTPAASPVAAVAASQTEPPVPQAPKPPPPSRCYQSDTGFHVHIKPGCVCPGRDE